MYVNGAIKFRRIMSFPQIKKTNKTIFIFLLIIVFCLSLVEYNNYKIQENRTLELISKPKVNDIYFLDFRLLSDKLRPKEKYRIAKVVDITGETITFLYGHFYYQYQNAAINSIKYSQLSYKDYFEPKRYDISHSIIKEMYNKQAIYLVERPIQNKLFGSLVGPERLKESSNYLIYGRNENHKGEAFLQQKFNEMNFEIAFKLFQESSNLGYAKGQVNLAEMYINGQYVKKDFAQALYWLKQSSLQSYKPAILKYGIICKQTKTCNLADFYKELTDYDVNIKVRKFDFKLSG